MDSKIPNIAVSAEIRLRGLSRETKISKILRPSIESQAEEICEIIYSIEHADRELLLDEYIDALKNCVAKRRYVTVQETTNVQVIVYYNHIGAAIFEGEEISISPKDIAEKEIFNLETVNKAKGTLAITAAEFFGEMAKHYVA